MPCAPQAKDSYPGIQEKLKEEYETAVSSICEVKKQTKLLMHDTRLSLLIKQRLPSMDILNFIQVVRMYQAPQTYIYLYI